MKKEFKKIMLEEITVRLNVKNELIDLINTEGTEFNSFMLHILEMLTEAINELEEGSTIIANSTIDNILAFKYTSKNLVLLIEEDVDSFKISSSLLEQILINCKSVLNAIEKIAELQKKVLDKLTPEELLVVLTT